MNYWEEIANQYFKVIKVNFTTDEVEIYKADKEELIELEPKSNSDYWCKFAESRFIHKDDVNAFIKFFSERDRRDFVYRRIINGETRWAYLQLIPIASQDEEYIVCVRDIDETYHRESEHIVKRIGMNLLLGNFCS